ncbi:UNVERIFIED_CONTAM: hypothetical protein Slati_1856900 [Sesamum latifolium]|uniref:RNase H type-1 domain-containing protein n=1 Tax=Sesamum latifolium TaxID=2727402 RepID=A0AAW2X155_9LAMI
MVIERGIEANPEKIEAISRLQSPKTLKEVQKLTGKIALLSRFISRSADRSLLFFKSLGKAKEFKWTEEYEAISSVLVREQEKIQNPVYYVSKMLQGAEKRYRQIEKLALALVVTARKLKPYFQSHKSRTAIKAQVLANFMVEFAGEPISEGKEGWLLHVDGSSNANNRGAGILLQGPKGIEIEVAARLSFATTNNKAEYKALILGLQLALEAGAKELNCSKSRNENERADALSKFGAMVTGVRVESSR